MNHSRILNSRVVSTLKARRLALAVPFATLCFGGNVAAFELDTGNPELRVFWDNTVKFSTAYRVNKGASDLSNSPSNTTDNFISSGNRNFERNDGPISRRLDLLSELDINYRRVGARFSGAAWYDDVYSSSNDNPRPTGYTPPMSKNYDEFTDDVEDMHGQRAELLDAFVYGSTEFADMSISGRLGRHSLMYGESLFFGGNAIAGGMVPVDVVKLASVPGSQFKETSRPIEQISGSLIINPNWSVGAYYQFKWEESRLPEPGSYFSPTELANLDKESLFFGITPTGETLAAAHGSDIEARDSGQGGMQVRWAPDAVDAEFGFYAIRFHDKTPKLYMELAPAGPPGVYLPNTYRFAYPEDINAYGVSFNTTVGSASVAGELSTRHNQPFASTGMAYIPSLGQQADNSDNPLYAYGKSAHANLSIATSLSRTFIADEGTFMGEVAWNRRLSVDENKDRLDPNADRDAWGMRFVYTPTYRQVLPGLDLSIPVGASYFPKGRSSVLGIGFGVDKGGDFSIGLQGTYLAVYNVALNYTSYYGSGGRDLEQGTNYLTFDQANKDKDFVSLTLSTSF